MKWVDPDEDGLVAFLCSHRQFNEDRIRTGAKKIKNAKGTSTQGRLDSFFKVLPSTATPKRKLEGIKKETPNKKAKKSVGGATRGRKPK